MNEMKMHILDTVRDIQETKTKNYRYPIHALVVADGIYQAVADKMTLSDFVKAVDELVTNGFLKTGHTINDKFLEVVEYKQIDSIL